MTHERRMDAFREAVWLRDGSGFGEDEGAPCAGCGRWVFRRRHPFAAVDHIKGRGAHPEEKYTPENGAIKCQTCHDTKHGRRTSNAASL